MRVNVKQPKHWISAALVCLLGFTFLVRVIPPLPLVFPAAGEVRLFGVDSYYHLRHARFAAKHFPHLQRFDHGSHYPRGMSSSTAGLFDLLIAAISLTIGPRQANAAPIGQVAAWLPPVLGTLGVLALFLLVSSISSRSVALLACALLTLYPGRFLNRSLLGFADHHVAEVLLVLFVLYGLVRCLENSVRRNPPWWRPAWLSALPLSLLYFTWVGAPVYLVLIALTFLILAIGQVASGLNTAPLARAVSRYGLGLIVTLVPFGLIRPELVMLPYPFYLSIAMAAGLTCGIPAWLWLGSWLTKKGFPGPVAGILMAGVLGISFILAIKIIPGADFLLGNLINVKTALVAEYDSVSLSLIWKRAGPSGLIALLAMPLVLIRLFYLRKELSGQSRTENSDPPGALTTEETLQLHNHIILAPIIMALLIIGLWWRTGDYGYMAPPFTALLAAWFSAQCFKFLSARRALPPWPKRCNDGPVSKQPASSPISIIAAISFSIAMVIPVWPLSHVASPIPSRKRIDKIMIINEGWVESLRWMKANTDEPSLPIDEPVMWRGDDFDYPPGTYGVMAAWDFGSFISAIGRRTPAASQQVYPFASSWLLLTDEKESLEALEQACKNNESFRYVAVDARTVGNYFLAKVRTSGHQINEYITSVDISRQNGDRLKLIKFNSLYAQSMAGRLFLNDGRGLSHYRLIYQSAHKSFLAYQLHKRVDEHGISTAVRRVTYPINTADAAARFDKLTQGKGLVDNNGDTFYDGKIYPTVKLFEIVRGASLVGIAPPYATIRARLTLNAGSANSKINYEKSVRADNTGHYEITVPYATGHMSGSLVQAGGDIRLSLAGENNQQAVFARIKLTDEQVRQGAVVEVKRR
jgi:dolichyl-diphosphooligosaccharide--protein glycosyltransferase